MMHRRRRLKNLLSDFCSPIPDDGFTEEIQTYNKEVEALGPDAHWYDVPWLFSECYLYR
jgi:hypothetical protein